MRDWIAGDGRLSDAIERWEARGEATLVRIVRRAADDNPVHARWLLAVRRPEVYSQAGMMDAARQSPPERSGVSLTDVVNALDAVRANVAGTAG